MALYFKNFVFFFSWHVVRLVRYLLYIYVYFSRGMMLDWCDSRIQYAIYFRIFFNDLVRYMPYINIYFSRGMMLNWCDICFIFTYIFLVP